MKKLLSLAFLAFLALAQPVQAGLIWYSNLDQNTGTTVTPNLGAQTCAFTNSPAWTTGKFNSGIDFDAGTVDYLDCGTSHITSTNDWTVALWIKLEDSAAFRPIVISGDNTLSGWALEIKTDDKFSCNVTVGADSTATSTSTATIDVTGAVWTHVACRKSGTAVTTWINGAQDGSATASSATMDYTGTTVKFRIGNYQAGTTTFLGQIDDVRIYDTVQDPALLFLINPTRRPMSPIIFQ